MCNASNNLKQNWIRSFVVQLRQKIRVSFFVTRLGMHDHEVCSPQQLLPAIKRQAAYQHDSSICAATNQTAT